MTAAILYGAGSGALYAVTGPDHVLSLGPVALRRKRGSFRVGLAWGVGPASVRLCFRCRFCRALSMCRYWLRWRSGANVWLVLALLTAAGVSFGPCITDRNDLGFRILRSLRWPSKIFAAVDGMRRPPSPTG